MTRLTSIVLYGIFFIILLLPSTSFAAFIESQTDNNIVYFLFSEPNKISRYDLSNKVFLDEITLEKTPSTFHVDNNKAYIGYLRELRSLDLTTENDRFIRNFSTTIKNIITVNEALYIFESNSTMTVLKKSDYSPLDIKDLNYNGVGFVGSDTQSSFYYRTTGISPSDINKATLNIDGTILSIEDSKYHGTYPSAMRLYLNTSENKIYDNAGIIYFSNELTFAGSLTESFDDLTFIGDNAIALRNNKLFIYDATNIEQGIIALEEAPTIITSYENTIISFYINNEKIQTVFSNIAEFSLPKPGDAIDPTGLPYLPDFIEHDNTDIIYLVDRETLSVFRWSNAQNKYLTSWSLLNPPTWVTYSVSHNRLYLGYENGKITYFDTSKESPIETHFISLASNLMGLLSVNDFLFAADNSGAWNTHYIINNNGKIIDSKEWREVGKQYIWNPQTSLIYHYRDGTSPNDIEWTALDQTSGLFGSNGDSPYHGDTLNTSYPIIISDDGKYILNGGGQIVDANNLTVVNSLSNNISDGVWIAGSLITIKEDSLSLQFWSDTFELLDNLPLNNSLSARVLKLNDKLLLIQNLTTGPTIKNFDINNLPDTDADTINDFQDNCPENANTDQLNSDNDTQGNICDLDDDNDSIPDDIEISYNLNPLDSSDADNDLDSDGFNNRIEYLLGSDLNDDSSTPSALSEYNEDFENGWPIGFFNSSDSLNWKVVPNGFESQYGFSSTYFSDTNNQSTTNFTALFQQGTFNFKYITVGYYAFYYDLTLTVDGFEIRYDENYIEGSQWRTISFNLSEGLHTIQFKITSDYLPTIEKSYFLIDDIVFAPDKDEDSIADTIDNCPEISNRWQEDSDNDQIGDACDNTPYNNDTDGDGFGQSKDNCPNTSNPEQKDSDFDGIGDACDESTIILPDEDKDDIPDNFDNCTTIKNNAQNDFDYDGIGDACDDDIDGDSISNNIENKYEFLDEKNKLDALGDFDNDGVNNLFEIKSGTPPDKKNTFTKVNLFDYFPLGNIEKFYFSDLNYRRETMKTTDQANVYTITSNDNGTLTIKKQTTGIYFLEATEYYDPEKKVVFDNRLLIPNELALGEEIINEITSTFFERQEKIYSSTSNISLQLIEISQTMYNGDMYPSITLRVKYLNTDGGIDYSYDSTYIKGIGPIEIGDMKLETITGDINAKPLNNNRPKSNINSSSKGGLGSLSWIVAIFFVIFLIQLSSKKSSTP